MRRSACVFHIDSEVVRGNIVRANERRMIIDLNAFRLVIDCVWVPAQEYVFVDITIVLELEHD